MEKKKRCEICHEWFTPHRFAPHQKRCKPECRKQQKAAANKHWQNKNPGYGKSRKLKIRTWAKNYPNYWQQYRKQHPGYVAKDNRRRLATHAKTQSAAKQDAASQVYIEKLSEVLDSAPVSAAKQDAAHSRINALLACLLWKENAAKQAAVASCLAQAP
jgi:hypothetical protein